jgi:hypothetical protein
MDGAVRTIFLIIHIVCAGIWLSELVASFVLRRLAKRLEGTPAEAWVHIGAGRTAALMGNIGGIGILISGFALIGVYRWGFLGLWAADITPAWVILKQALFVVALALTFAVIVPSQRRVRKPLMAAAENAGTITDAERAVLSRTRLVSTIIGVAVLLNIIIGVWRPTF